MTDAKPAASRASYRADPLSTPVQYVKGVGPQLAMLLGKMGIQTAGDLVLHFPHRYEDRSQLRPIVELRDGEKVTVVGQLAGSEAVRTKNNKFLFKAYRMRSTPSPTCAAPDSGLHRHSAPGIGSEPQR